MKELFPRELLAKAFPGMPRLWAAFEDQAETVFVDHAERITGNEVKIEAIEGTATEALVTAQASQIPHDNLDALSNLAPDAGAVEQVATGVFSVRAIGTSDSSSLLTRGTLIVAAPSTATSAGTAGQIAYDTSFFYVCVGTNTWRRVAIATW